MATNAAKQLAQQEESKLTEVHEIHSKYFEEWRFLNAAYEGVRALVAYGALLKHERETETNYERRQDGAYGFSYSKSVVDIFNSYLFKNEFPQEIPKALMKDEQWSAFMGDCNLEGDSFDSFFVDRQRDASILGHIGLLVDKPSVEKLNRKEEKDDNIYPYVVAYKPMAILDWEWERDETGRKRLTYLKLLDDDDRYRIWTLETWEVWEIVSAVGGEQRTIKEVSDPGEQPTQAEIKGKGQTANKIMEGVNELGEIPFFILYNQRSNIDREVGVSDIIDVSRIDASIIRNMSQIEEIIDYAAFPMMRKPMKEMGAGGDQKDEVGPTAILEFDPEKPEAKPDWLNSEVAGPVQAILSVVDKKIAEIYRSSNIGGMAATEISKSAKSGVALKTEFQLLNSKLVKKGKNVAKAKMKVAEYWLKWQDQWEKYKDEVQFDHVRTFEVQDLTTDLENLLTSTVLVTTSDKFKEEIQKAVVRMVLPTVDKEVLSEIDSQIEEVSKKMGIMSFFASQEGQQPPPGQEGSEVNPPQGAQGAQGAKVQNAA